MTRRTGASRPRWAFINYPADMGARAKRWGAALHIEQGRSWWSQMATK